MTGAAHRPSGPTRPSRRCTRPRSRCSQRAGVRVESPAARELLLAAGCTAGRGRPRPHPARRSRTRSPRCPRVVHAGRPRPEQVAAASTRRRGRPTCTTWAARATSSTRAPASGGAPPCATRSLADARHAPPASTSTQVTSLVAAGGRARPARAAVLLPRPRPRDRQGASAGPASPTRSRRAYLRGDGRRS